MPRFATAIARVLAVAAPIAMTAVGPAAAQGVLTVAMTAGDMPVTTGNPDQGFEGFRFVGYNLYDALSTWDLSKRDKPSDIKPGLATELAGRSGQPQPLDLQPAPRGEMARRLRLHRR